MFGGTFNPPHNGHIAAAKACVAQLHLDKLIFIPTAIPPHKALPSLTATAEERLEMTYLASQLVPNAEVSDMELCRGGASYTCETLKHLREKYPHDELWIVIGTDMAETFESWYQPQKICDLARLALVARAEDDGEKIKLCADNIANRFNAKIDIIQNVPLKMSSTEIRGGDEGKIPEKVKEYIAEKCLYTDIDALRERVKGRLSEKRFAHTVGCEKMAAALSEKYGGNEKIVRVAALLHDITKELSLPQQLHLCEMWSIMHDYPSVNIYAVIHADTAAAVAKYEFGFGEPVCSAVKKHTVGDTVMSVEDKIVFVADACEETRTYPEAEKVRALAFEDLDEAIIYIVKRTAERLEQKGVKPYYMSQKVIDAFCKDRERSKE